MTTVFEPTILDRCQNCSLFFPSLLHQLLQCNLQRFTATFGREREYHPCQRNSLHINEKSKRRRNIQKKERKKCCVWIPWNEFCLLHFNVNQIKMIAHIVRLSVLFSTHLTEIREYARTLVRSLVRSRSQFNNKISISHIIFFFANWSSSSSSSNQWLALERFTCVYYLPLQ